MRIKNLRGVSEIRLKKNSTPSPWKRRKTTSSAILRATGAWVLNYKRQIFYLKKTKNASTSHVFWSFDWLKSDKRDVHRHQLTDAIKGRIRHVQLMLITAHQKQAKYMKGDEVDDVNVTAPSWNHVKIAKSCQNTPENWSSLHSSDPEKEWALKGENSDSFIIGKSDQNSNQKIRDKNLWGPKYKELLIFLTPKFFSQIVE